MATALELLTGLPGSESYTRFNPARGLGLLQLPVDRVQPDPRSPRRVFNDDALEQLAESIKSWGQLQPVVVRRLADVYQLVCGERRWRAHLRAGLENIWAVERHTTDEGALALALVENLHRVDLSHAEKVAGLDQLAELAQSMGLRKTAQQLHMDAGWLSRQLSVHRDPIIFPALEAGRVGFGQAAELCRAPQTHRQELIERIEAAPGRVSTAVVRTWVEEARGHAQVPYRRRRPRGAGRTVTNEQVALTSILNQLNVLGTPRTSAGRAALQDLLQQVQRMVVEASTLVRTPQPNRPAPKRTLVELACLMCGERAGTIVESRVVAVRPGSIDVRGRRLVCGRCSGSLAPDARVDQYVYGKRAPVAVLSGRVPAACSPASNPKVTASAQPPA